MIAGFDPTVGSVALVGLGGVLTAFVWYAFGTPYAIAAGHVVLLGLFPDGIDRSSFVLAETAFVTMLLVSAPRTSRPYRFAAVAIAGTLGVTGTAWLALETGSLRLATGALFAVLGLATYGVHRYELVRLGLVSESTDSPDEGVDTDEPTTADANATGSTQL
ncbi:hypothetical protein [Halomontanus rarus]|uniref:hypothetical protein n=1 Tax=Halomontanus rarus TaxID=3034020 RepID=UPI0023E84ABC|nr:hypothetical protein [Halovivax sp. TS33]